MSFDAYHRWLGIPPGEQPPNHYRLLGIAPLEDNPDVIEAAADRQMGHLRTYQSGKHSALSQKLLNEVAAAKVCLLNPQKKAEYDSRLREQMAAAQQAAAQEQAAPLEPGLAKLFEKTTHAPTLSPPAARRLKPTQLWAGAGIVALGLVALVVILIRAGGSSKPAPPRGQSVAVQGDHQSPPKAPPLPKGPSRATGQRPVPPPKDTSQTQALPKSAKGSGPAPAESDSPSAHRLTAPVDLLAMVDPAKHAVEGQWRREGTVLISPKVRFARIQIPLEPPEEYDLVVEGRRKEGLDMLYLGLIGGGRHFGVVLDGWPRVDPSSGTTTTVCGLQLIDGKDAYGNVTRRNGTLLLKPDRPFTIVCAVRKDRVTVRVDGHPVLDWRADFSRCSMQDKWSVPNQRQFALGAFDSVFEITAMRLVPPGGAQPETPPVLAPQRLPVPAQGEREKVLAQLNQVYDLGKERAPSEKRKLAADLLALAEKAKDRPAERYVLLEAAMRMAGEGGDAATMLDVADRIGGQFDVDVLALKADALKTFAEAAKDSARIGALVEASEQLIAEAIGQDNYDLARELASRAYAACQQTAGREHRKRAFDRRNEVQALAAAWQEVQSALDKLKTDANDPEANLTAGRYFALAKGDWRKGLPMLALGADAALKELAAKELKSPESAEEQLAVADGWWDAAEKAAGQERDAMRLHAGSWYQEVEGKPTSTLVKAKVRKRLEEIGKLGRPIPELPARKPPPAVAPFDEKAAKRHQERWAKHLNVPVVGANSIGMKFVLIPPGEFQMGSAKEEIDRLQEQARRQKAPQPELDRLASEGPNHRVRITKPYYLGLCEVTQAEYERVTGKNPSQFKGDPNRPVEMVNWDDAVEFCRSLTELPAEKAQQAVYRLPTEAEWEYACRAGTTTRYSFGDDAAPLGQHAWCWVNAQSGTHPAARLRPNPWGLFDVHGNVFEWSGDWHAAEYYARSPGADPTGPDSGAYRVQRGGSWARGVPDAFRGAYRSMHSPGFRGPDLGFRVAITLPPGAGGLRPADLPQATTGQK